MARYHLDIKTFDEVRGRVEKPDDDGRSLLAGRWWVSVSSVDEIVRVSARKPVETVFISGKTVVISHRGKTQAMPMGMPLCGMIGRIANRNRYRYRNRAHAKQVFP
jgi:hypothetical protein